MKKNLPYILLVLVIFILCQTSFAQSETQSKPKDSSYKATISINFLEPILKVITKNTAIDSNLNLKAPFIYIGKQTPKMLYRIGARVSMKNKSFESDLFTDKRQENYNKFDLTISGLRMKSISNKLKFGYGLVATSFVLFDTKVFDSGFDKVTFNNRTWSVAAGPNFMLQYQINKRLSLFTEYILAYQYSNSYSGKKFSAFPEENYANDISRQHGIQIDYPISIYITYHF